jgi:hypothetical protein
MGEAEIVLARDRDVVAAQHVDDAVTGASVFDLTGVRQGRKYYLILRWRLDLICLAARSHTVKPEGKRLAAAGNALPLYFAIPDLKI